MSKLDTGLTIAIAAATAVQSVFAALLWRLQNVLDQERRQAFVAVVLHTNPNVNPRVVAYFENASSSGVLFRYLTLVARAKGRSTDPIRLDFRMSIPGYGSRDEDITEAIYKIARAVDDADPTWRGGGALTVSVDIEPHYTTIVREKRKGPRVVYKLEFSNGALKFCDIDEDED